MKIIRYSLITLCFLLWLWIGLQRISWADYLSLNLSYIPFIKWFDTVLIALLLLVLNASIIKLGFKDKKKIIFSVLVQTLILLVSSLVTLLYKFFPSVFLHNLSENLLRFYFSPLLMLLLILYFYLHQKLNVSKNEY